jgi:hypothetical protein
MTTTTDTPTYSIPSGDAPLYHKYPRQTDPQPSYVYLGCATGQIGADWSGEIGNAVPMDVFHGHTRCYGVDARIKRSALIALMDQIKPLADRVFAGYESVWDGNNHVAKFDADATEADESIEALCENADDLCNIFDEIDDYLYDDRDNCVDRVRGGEMSKSIAEEIIAQAASCEVVLAFDADDIETWIDNAVAQSDDLGDDA